MISRESATDDMEGLLYSFRKAKKGKQARQDFKVRSVCWVGFARGTGDPLCRAEHGKQEA